MELKIILIPILGFIIGALTNYIAIKLIFHPHKKIFGIQGLIPKRKKILAQKIGKTAPEIMPPNFKKIEKIPVIGKAIIIAFQNSVEDRINSLETEELEKIIISVMNKELNFLIWIGGILGFFIGILQLLIVI